MNRPGENRKSAGEQYNWALRALVTAVTTMWLLPIGPASAGVPVWIAGDGNWSVPGNWSTMAVPAAGDAVKVFNIDGVSRTITYDYTGPAVTLGLLFVNLNGGSTPTDTEILVMSANNLTAGTEYIGYSAFGGSNGSGTFNQSGGVNTIDSMVGASDGLVLGYNSTDKGIYNLGGSGFLGAFSGDEILGRSGTGVFSQTGGTNVIVSTHALYLGFSQSSTGTYNLNSGSLTASGGETIGEYGSGTFNQSGGTNSLSSYLYLAFAANSSGAYNLGGNGVLTVLLNEFVGYNATAIFTQTGGTHIVLANLDFGYNNTGSFGVYNLSETGALKVTGYENVGIGGAGTFNQTGGTNTSGSLVLANNAGSSGVYLLSGGFASVSGSVYVGGSSMVPGGTGTLSVGGAGVLTVGGTLTVYNTPGSAIILGGGTINTAALNFNGTLSLLNWTGGTLNLTSNVTFDSAAAGTTTSAAFGSSLTLGNNQTLMVTGNETLGGVGPFALTLNSGGTHYVTGTLTLSPTGSVSQDAASTLYAGTFTQAGGTVNGTLQNQGVFNYQSGSFNGRLINQGSVNTGPSFTAANGVENDASITLAAGQTLTVNGAGLDNLGTFTLSGGTISGAGPVLNDFGGTMLARGTINPPLANNGVLTVTGVLRLNNASPAVNNGVINGSGTILGSVSNSAGGLIQVTAGSDLAINSTWTNLALVTLQGSGAVLGGNTITNTGTIQGAGLVSSPLANSTGVIRASGGELDLGGTGNTNGAAAQIQAGAGNTVLVIHGLTTNAGTIALSGGTFDNNNQPITNAATGYIIGSGTLRSGGLTNHGHVTFADNPTSLYGSVTTAGTGSVVNLINNTTTFYAPVTIAADSSLVSSNATARFLAGVTGSVTPGLANQGAAAFAGSNAVYGTVANTGAVTVGGGSSVFLNGQYSGTGSIVNSGTIVFNTSAAAPDTIGGVLTNNASASLVVEGDGSVEVTAAPTLANSSSIAINNTSRLKFNVVSGSPTIGTGVTATVSSGATLELAGSVSALSSSPNRVNIINNSSAAAGILVSGTHQQVGNIDGSGTTQVNAGSDLTANHIIQSALIIGGTAGSPATVTIDASDAYGYFLAGDLSLADSLTPAGPFGAGISSASTTGGSAKSDSSSDALAPLIGNLSVRAGPPAVPEPSSMILLAIGGLGLAGRAIVRRARVHRAHE